VAVTGTPAQATAATPAAAAVSVRALTPAARIERYRRRLLLALVLGSLLAAVTGAVVLAANAVTYNRYRAIVSDGSVSVDAAQDARADVLDNAGSNADLLAQTDANIRKQDRARASQQWESFKNHLRIAWQNQSDRSQGEFAVFNAADLAGSDYAGWIGAMDAAVDANRPDDARPAFLNAYNVLQTRLLPALLGLQSTKVEFMEAQYASTSNTIRIWLVALGGVTAALLLLAGFGYLLTRRMHHRFTPEIVAAILLALAISVWVGVQLRRADTQAKVMVRDAYDTVAGVRDEIALVSQQHALESIAIFDPAASAGHFKEFDDYNLRFEQGLCGADKCSATPFLAPNAASAAPVLQVAPGVVTAALEGKNNFGLPRPPLIANVHFKGEPQALEAARDAYRRFLTADQDIRSKTQASNTAGALATDSGASTQAFSATVGSLNDARAASRSVYDSIWRSVQDAARIGEFLSIGMIVTALLLASGLWRRRRELYAANVR
jgi:hypothetical protein